MRRSSGSQRTIAALVAITVVALIARLYNLGWRVAHQDEGRVGSWTLHYMASGQWKYRAIIHGPFIPHVNGIVFSIFGANDFTARMVMAIIGGLLPLSAWLFRERLRTEELVALALVLAFDPVLLYYSRFMRNDVILAAVMFVSLGFFVRTLDTRRPLYLYLAAFAMALGFTMKENAVLYPICWLGGLALVLDRHLLLRAARGERPGSGFRRYFRRKSPDEPGYSLFEPRKSVFRAVRKRAHWILHAIAAVVLFAVVVFLFYAPLPDLYHTLGNPSQIPGFVGTTYDHISTELGNVWFSNNYHGHSYLPYEEFFLKRTAHLAAPLAIAAVVGFLIERYRVDGHRDIVELCFYWGVASLIGYPIIVDINAAWNLAHVFIALAIPAAVGFGAVFRLGRGALRDDDRISVALAAIVLLVAAGATGAVAVQTSYMDPQGTSNKMVQYAQPAGHMQPTLNEIRKISKNNSGVDVMYYGDKEAKNNWLLYSPNEKWKGTNNPPAGWFSRLPLPWYFQQYGAQVASTNNASTLARNPPPVVIALGAGHAKNNASDVDPYLRGKGYSRTVYQQYQNGRPIVFYIKTGNAGGQAWTNGAADSLSTVHAPNGSGNVGATTGSS